MSKREYKSSVFSLLMENKEYALEVYNALNGTKHADPNMISINKLPVGVMLSVRNDASFVIDDFLNIYEHQSTYTPNMPLRDLFYVTDLIRKQIKWTNMYTRKKVNIPTPHFVVFYNGLENRPAVEKLKLSDLYTKHTDEPELELICTVYNINKDKNDKLLGECKILREYMFFVDKVREGLNNGMDIDNAIDEAIEECVDKDIFRDFLLAHESEVRELIIQDYTYESREKAVAEDSREEGKVKIIIEMVCRKLKKEKRSSQIAKELELDENMIERIVEIAKNFAPDYNEEAIYEAYKTAV